MKIRKFVLLGLAIAAVILEILPRGAVCIILNPEGENYRMVFSYFDLTPYGYANFGPFITALLSCALLVLAVIYLLRDAAGIRRAVTYVSAIAFAVSLTPLLYGTAYFTVVAGLISLVLLAILILSAMTGRRAE